MNSPTNPQAKRHLGQILIDQGILTEDQLRIALLEQTKQHVPVGRLLVQLGFVSEATLRDALSEKLGLQAVDLSRIIVDPSALKLVPRDMARRYRIFPVALDRQGKKLIVALDHMRQTRLASEYYQRAVTLAEKRGASFDLAAARLRVTQLSK